VYLGRAKVLAAKKLPRALLERSIRMKTNLKNALMAGLTATALLATPFASKPARAESGGITVSTDDSSRTVYVNDGSAPSPSTAKRTSGTSTSGLMYWSVTEHRYKPVPTSGAMMRAARSAASEVSSYLGDRRGFERPYGQSLNVGFTAAEIDAAIEQAAARHKVDPNLVRSVVKVESNFNPNAVSRKGAMGLMQLMPATARSLNVSNPFDPQQNVDAGVRHLKQLLESYNGDVRLSLAAYNAGAGAVARSAGVPKYRETRNYVRRITELYAGGGAGGTRVTFSAVREPVHMERDARGVLYISNTD